jgi:hypothetical protein
VGKTTCRCAQYVCADAEDMMVVMKTGHHPHCNEALLRLKLSPELGDGVSHTIITDVREIVDLLEDFMVEQEIGAKATIELVLMTHKEVEELESV